MLRCPYSPTIPISSNGQGYMPEQKHLSPLHSRNPSTMAPEDFGQRVRPTAAIRNILDSYPLSVGILRELLQNSDDARATKQVRITVAFNCGKVIHLLVCFRFSFSTVVHILTTESWRQNYAMLKDPHCWPSTTQCFSQMTGMLCKTSTSH